MGITKYRVHVHTLVIAPYRFKGSDHIPEGKYNGKLKGKKGDPRDHVDQCFLRIKGYDGNGQLKPTILGNAIRGAINRFFKQTLKRNPPPELKDVVIFGLQCNEEDVDLYQYQIVTQKGEATLVNVEVIKPNKECILYADEKLGKILSELGINPIPLVIGKHRKMGFGIIELYIK